MSPRRKVDSDEPDFFEPGAKPPRRWGLPVLSVVVALLIATAIGAGAFMAVRHETDHRMAIRDADAVGYVSAFMTLYTTLDPFHANDYGDRVLAQATGDFEKAYKDKLNEVLVQVAQAEPTVGTVVDAGVQRWNDNGSADVLVATKTSRKSPDGKTTIESGDRWIATTIKEGQQWKISQLIPLI